MLLIQGDSRSLPKDRHLTSLADDSNTCTTSSFLTLLIIAIVLLQDASAFAGITSGQLVVVVNGRSSHSRAVANHYSYWRNIPAKNIIVLDSVPDQETIPVEDFRKLILKPLFDEIEKRNLSPQLQAIAYSASFPSAIDVTGDLKGIKDRPFFLTPTASINGLTYLYPLVLTSNPGYIGLEINMYARRDGSAYFRNPLPSTEAEQWAKIEKFIQEKSHKDAAEHLEQLLVERPHQFPIAYRAAEQFALAGQVDKSLDMLDLAIAEGWKWKKSILENENFSSLKENDQFKDLIKDLPDELIEYQPTIGFDARRFWAPNGVPSPSAKDGFRYMPCTMLAVTRGQGNSLKEALDGLKRAISADYTHPQGSFYFTLTKDVRTTTRQPAFDMAIRELKKRGYGAEVVPNNVPLSKNDCLGVMLGIADFNWSRSLSTLLPGAIAENLTSLGGIVPKGAGQTKFSEFIRHGAAAASGTVAEPYSIQAKFPHPMMHVHYTDGCTLVEAFYQALTGPYQLLIVGDPLCQPFCNPPKFELQGFDAEKPIEKRLRCQLSIVEDPKNSKPSEVMLVLDGQVVQVAPFPQFFDLSFVDMPRGEHELRLIATDNSRVSHRFELVTKVKLAHDHAPIEVKLLDRSAVKPSKDDPANTDRVFELSAPGAKSIVLRHDFEELGKIDGEKGELRIPFDRLGDGPLRIQASASYDKEEVLGTVQWLQLP